MLLTVAQTLVDRQKRLVIKIPDREAVNRSVDFFDIEVVPQELLDLIEIVTLHALVILFEHVLRILFDRSHPVARSDASLGDAQTRDNQTNDNHNQNDTLHNSPSLNGTGRTCTSSPETRTSSPGNGNPRPRMEENPNISRNSQEIPAKTRNRYYHFMFTRS